MIALDPTQKLGHKPRRESACVDLSEQNEFIVTFKERQQQQKITVILFPFLVRGLGAKT